jgi:hypothetical protein
MNSILWTLALLFTLWHLAKLVTTKPSQYRPF